MIFGVENESFKTLIKKSNCHEHEGKKKKIHLSIPNLRPSKFGVTENAHIIEFPLDKFKAENNKIGYRFLQNYT